MCGRFALTVPQSAVAALFRAAPMGGDPADAARPRTNIRPTQPVDAVLLDDGDETGGRTLRRVRWGVVPHWRRRLNDGPPLINARAETIAEKPAFREACRRRRCLIPASGYYEWRLEDGRKQPYFIHPTQGELFAFAGIWSPWRSPEGETVIACAIVTCAAGPGLAAIHHREPVTIRPEDFGKWLGEAGRGAALLMRPAPEGAFAFHRVSPKLNKAKDDAPDLTAPIGDSAAPSSGR